MSSDPDPTPTGGEFTATPRFKAASRPLTGPLSAEELITLNEEIAAMAKAGLPLDQGLSVLAKEMGSGRLKTLTEQIAADLRAGFTLPQALERQQGSVPSYYAALLNAGIRSGKLGEVLATLTAYARAMADFRAAVINALLYPCVVALLGFVLLAVVSFTILPEFEKIFLDFKLSLPWPTEMLIFVSRHPFEFIVLPPVTLVVGFVVARMAFNQSPAGRMMWARFVNMVPVVGTLIRASRLAAFVDLLGLLVDQAVPLPDALRLATEASADPLLAEGGKQVELDLRQGIPLGAALHRQRLVPELIVFMVNFGERQGTLGTALHQLAQMYRRHADVRATLLRTILPPLLIILLAGTLVGFFVFGLFAPLIGLLDGLSGGGKM